MAAGSRGRGPQRGEDLLLNVEIELHEAARGCKKSVTVPRKEQCPDCSGSGCKKGTQPVACRQCKGQGVVLMNQGFFRVQQTCRACGGSGAVITDPCPTCVGRGRISVKRTLEVAIPAGVFSDARLQVRGEGEAGAPGGPRGDLYLEIRVREHRIFQRKDDHLICEVPITFSQAALGAEIEIPTLDGVIKHKLERGIQSGDHLRVPSKGMPNLRNGRPGDLLVLIKVVTPRGLNKNQEELFRELAEIDKKNVSPEHTSFLEKLKVLFTGKKDENETKEGGDPMSEAKADTPAAAPAKADELETLRKQANEFRDLALRTRAEFENYQKRNQKDREQERRYWYTPLVLDILPVLDNLERTLAAAKQAGDEGALVQGVAMVQGQFLEMLKRHGITPIDADGQPFDPNIHQAVMQKPSPDHESGTILQVLEQGFMNHDRVLRPAKVVVSSK